MSLSSLIAGSPGKKKLVTVVALVVLVGAIASLIRTCRSGVDRRLHPLYRAFGEIVADETIKLTGSAGEIVLQDFEPEHAPNPTLDVPVEAFVATLKKKAPGLKIVATERVPLTILQAISEESRVELRQQFYDLLRKYPPTTTLVTFVGTPGWFGGDTRLIPKERPKLVFASIMGLGPPPEYLDDGIVQVAIVPDQKEDATIEGSLSGRQLFDQFFKIVKGPEK